MPNAYADGSQGIDPLWQDDGIIRWDQFWMFPTSEFDTETLLPTGLYMGSVHEPS